MRRGRPNPSKLTAMKTTAPLNPKHWRTSDAELRILTRQLLLKLPCVPLASTVLAQSLKVLGIPKVPRRRLSGVVKGPLKRTLDNVSFVRIALSNALQNCLTGFLKPFPHQHVR